MMNAMVLFSIPDKKPFLALSCLLNICVYFNFIDCEIDKSPLKPDLQKIETCNVVCYMNLNMPQNIFIFEIYSTLYLYKQQYMISQNYKTYFAI